MVLNGVFGVLQNLKPKGMKFGTERTRAILDELSSPDLSLKIIHIAGSNGKGSVAELITSVLIAAGKRVGTFTSPEVYSYFDQFRIDGKPIPAKELELSFNAAYRSGYGKGATSFEIETAGAILAFERAKCEYAVIECGLGGLNDATNAVKNKEVALISSVSLEHTAVLGKTISEICAQKAGIIRGCPAFASALQCNEAKKFFEQSGIKMTAEPQICEGGFIYEGEKYNLSAIGCAQPYNAALAIECAKLLGIDKKAVRKGIESAVPCGRLEIIKRDGRTYILDGAHNPAAFVPLKNLLESGKISKDRTIIFGCLSDKDIDGNLSALNGLAERVIAIKCDSPRATDLEKTENTCRKYFKDVSTAASVSQALQSARSQAVIVCGSFTTLKEAKEWTEKRQ